MQNMLCLTKQSSYVELLGKTSFIRSVIQQNVENFRQFLLLLSDVS